MWMYTFFSYGDFNADKTYQSFVRECRNFHCDGLIVVGIGWIFMIDHRI